MSFRHTLSAAFLLGIAACFLPVVLPSSALAAVETPDTVRVSGDANEAVKYDPATTTIAILPVIDRTGEKVTERRKRQEWTGYYNIAELFHERAFKIADPAAVKKAIADQELDLQDEESYRRDNFYKVAQAVNADLVVFVAVMETREDRKTSIWTNDKNGEIQGRATVKVWLLDAKRHKPILSAIQKEGKAAGAVVGFDLNAGTRRRANAVGNAIKEEFEDFLRDYKKVSKEGLKDWPYLAEAEAEMNPSSKRN